ncbi:MAG: translation initiation factor [Deltaproteobacteria bacterium]|nr:translation initiation factor [Deltaproteobacteria bacterium]
MGSDGKKDGRQDAPFNNPFAALAAKRDALPPGEPVPVPAEKPQKGPARAVVRMERTGRGGKEVTVVEQLGLPPAELAAWCKALKGALGCGGTVEGDNLVLQGDQRERVGPLLEKRGVRKVTVG